MTLQPIGDKIILKRLEQPNKRQTAGGIFLPEQLDEKSHRGEIVAVGDGYWIGEQHHDLRIKRGDVVIYSTYAGTNVDIEGETYVLIAERDILCIVKEEPPFLPGAGQKAA